MQNNIMRKKSFVFGAIILSVSQVVCKILGAIFRIPLTSLIGTNGIGVYQLVFPIYALFLVLASSGIPVAISKIISRENSKENFKNIKIIFSTSIKLMSILGILFSVLIIILSFPIASVQNNSQMYILYIFLAPSLFFSSILASFRGYFQGFQIMQYSAISQIIEQIFKLIFGLILAYLLIPYGIIYGVLGAILGIFISEFFAFIYMFFMYKKKKIKVDFTKNFDKEISKKESFKLIVKESFPITLSSIIIPVTSVVDSLIIIKLLAKVGFSFSIASTLYGLDSGVVASLINLPTVIAFSLGISLMPALSESFAKNDLKEVSFKAKLSLKLVWYFVLPCTLVFFLYSTNVCGFLYSNLGGEVLNQLEIAALMLKLSSFSIIYVAINQIVTTTLQALNKSYLPFFVILFSSLLKIVLTIVLVLTKTLNIYGLVLSDVIASGLMCVINLMILKKYIKINFTFKEIVLAPVLSLFFMYLVLLAFRILLIKNFSKILFVLAVFASFVVYILCVLIFKGFNLKEIKNTKILKFFKKKKY